MLLPGSSRGRRLPRLPPMEIIVPTNYPMKPAIATTVATILLFGCATSREGTSGRYRNYF